MSQVRGEDVRTLKMEAVSDSIFLPLNHMKNST